MTKASLQKTAHVPLGGFTLVELMVSMLIVVLMVGMVAYAFQSVRRLVGSTVGIAETSQMSRNLFDQIQRDISGINRNGFLLVRKEGGMRQDIQAAAPDMRDYVNDTIDFDGMQQYVDSNGVWQPQQINDRFGGPVNLAIPPKTMGVRNEDGQIMQTTIGRTDWMVMVTSGVFTSQSDKSTPGGVPYASLTSNFARVIYAHSNRCLANLRTDWSSVANADVVRAGSMANNWSLLREQTLLYPLLGRNPNFTGVGDGSGSEGLSMAPTAADVADMPINDLMALTRSASRDGTYNGRVFSNPGQAAIDPYATTDMDWGDYKPEVAFLRVKRDDLDQERITDGNPGDIATGTAGQILGRLFTYRSNPLQANTGSCEGYQRPRILADLPGPDGNINTVEDNQSSMYGKLIVPRCAHFRVDFTCGTTNERGELVWESMSYTYPASYFSFLTSGRPWGDGRDFSYGGGSGGTTPFGAERPQVTAFSPISPKTAREEAVRHLGPIRNPPSGFPAYNPQSPRLPEDCANRRWPSAIRVQVVVIDTAGRDPLGYMYQRIMPMPRL